MSSKPAPVQQKFSHNPADWPAEVLPLFERAFTCEFSSLTGQGVPITFPLTPYLGDDERTLDVSTGLTYPAKAERVRRNPKVSLLYSDPVSTGLAHPPVVLVHGLASVRDADLQANTDRYVRLSLAKSPAGFKGTPGFMLKRLPWYFARIWIEVMPFRILWWPAGQTDELPQTWQAPAETQARPSDPSPAGKPFPAWKEPPADWRPNASHAAQKLGLPILTTVDTDGYPVPVRVKSSSLTSEGFRLDMPAGVSITPQGRACLTFHSHPEVFARQENKAFIGQVTPADEGSCLFTVERALADWSLAGSRFSAARSFFSHGRLLVPRLEAEAERRGQAVPVIHVPDFW